MFVWIVIVAGGALGTFAALRGRKPEREYGVTVLDRVMTWVPDPWWTIVNVALGLGVTGFGVWGLVRAGR